MKKVLLVVALFIFCSVCYSKGLRNSFTPPKVIEREQCKFVTLALTSKYEGQVENLFDNKRIQGDFFAYIWGFYHSQCLDATQEGSIAGALFEEYIKDSINNNALGYINLFKELRESLLK